jgi:hypothetical protein
VILIAIKESACKMKYQKSNLEKSEELVELINKKTKYKSKVSYFNALCFARGNTITIERGFFKSIQLVYDFGDIIFYTRLKPSYFSEFTKEVINQIEKLTKKEVIIKDKRLITLGGI